MSETPSGRGDHPRNERPVADGGTEVASGPMWRLNVSKRTRATSQAEVPRLGDSDHDHLFGPADLPPWALSLPVVGALAVAVGAQGSTVLAGGAGSAWWGTVLATIGILVVVSLAVRSA